METICVEIIIHKKFRILFAYRPPNNNNIKLLFEETTLPVNQLLSKFYIIVAGNFQIDTGSKETAIDSNNLLIFASHLWLNEPSKSQKVF